MMRWYGIPMLAALAIAAGGVQANDEATMKELATTGKLRVGVVAAPSMSAFFVTKDAAESFVCAPGWKPGT